MKNYLKECFNYKGRWNRKKFWLYPLGFYILFGLAILLLLFLLNVLGIDSTYAPQIISILFTLFYVSTLVVGIFSYIKRLRDMDKNPWMVLLILVPFANIYLAIICGFIKGTVGPNKYGPDPLGVTASNNVVEIEKNTTDTTSIPTTQNQTTTTDEVIIVDKKIENTEVLATENTETVTIETPSTSNTEIKPEQKIEL